MSSYELHFIERGVVDALLHALLNFRLRGTVGHGSSYLLEIDAEYDFELVTTICTTVVRIARIPYLIRSDSLRSPRGVSSAQLEQILLRMFTLEQLDVIDLFHQFICHEVKGDEGRPQRLKCNVQLDELIGQIHQTLTAIQDLHRESKSTIHTYVTATVTRLTTQWTARSAEYRQAGEQLRMQQALKAHTPVVPLPTVEILPDLGTEDSTGFNVCTEWKTMEIRQWQQRHIPGYALDGGGLSPPELEAARKADEDEGVHIFRVPFSTTFFDLRKALVSRFGRFMNIFVKHHDDPIQIHTDDAWQQCLRLMGLKGQVELYLQYERER